MLTPPSWDDMYLILAIMVIILGPPIIHAIVKKPRLFWPILIVVIILGNGPKVVSYSFLDEIFTGIIVISALIHLELTRKSKNRASLIVRSPVICR